LPRAGSKSRPPTADPAAEPIAAAEPGRDRTLAALRAKLRAQELRARAILENLAHGVSLYDRRGRLVRCNQQFLDIYRLPASLGRPGTTFRKILEGRIANNTFVGDDAEAYLADRLAAVGEGRTLGGIHRLNSGQVISMTHQPMADGGWVSTHKDVTELQNMQAELTHLAYHDALTGLPNRALFYRRIATAFATLDSVGFAVLCLDLDGFKPINDTLGHAAGDTLLRQFAGRLAGCLASTDTAARMGGDEFVVLHRGTVDTAQALAYKISAELQAPFDLDGHIVTIAVGIGYAVAGVDGRDTDGLLHSADLALYAAKRERRGGIRGFDPELDRAAADRRRIEGDLKRALEHGEFELHFQPILDLQKQRIRGFEALLRWQHPDLGLIPPSDFIPVAEDTGLIAPIGAWVIREALAEAARWPEHLHIAVNVSSVQLVRGGLVETVVQALASSGIAHGRVEIEITESVFLENSEQSLETLRQLRALGIRIALDDFGTGFSALGYLLAFPFDKIKIDGTFVRALSSTEGAKTIVAAVAEIGARLDMETTAEGIETAEQLRAVHAAGYTEAQGYLISRPMPREAVRSLLAAAFDQMPESPLNQRAAG